MSRGRVVRGLSSLVIGCFVALQPGAANASCPPPATTVCPPGTTFDAAADRCQAEFHPCLPGYFYSTSSSQCEASPVPASALICPAGSSFNSSLGKCQTANLSPCPGGYTYNAYSNKCEIPATFTPADSCPGGYSFDPVTNKCVGFPNSACIYGGGWGYYEQACCSMDPLDGFLWDVETGQYIGPWACPPAYANYGGTCSGPKVTANCPAGSTINAATSKCEAAAGAACAAGQTYNTYSAKCDFAPPVSAVGLACAPGYILNVDTNACAGVTNSACIYGGGWGYYEQACCSMDPLDGFLWDVETGQYIGPWACPPGYSNNGGICSGMACPAGHAYDATTSSCQPSGCPPGTAKSDNLCVAAAVCQPASTLVVDIDIKPGSYPNSINLGSGGIVPVAILGSATFDAAAVDPTTVTLSSSPVVLRGNGLPSASTADVNGDGFQDLVVHVVTEALELTSTSVEAILQGRTYSGQLITGSDSVNIVP